MTAALGDWTELPVKKAIPAGWLLDGGSLGDVLLPGKDADSPLAAGDTVRVFLYADGQNRPQATCRAPLAICGEVASLKVTSTSKVGAFLHWGPSKDLLLPFAEQQVRPEEGRYQLVMVCRDREGRPMASAKLDRFLEDTCDQYAQGDAVPVVVSKNTDLGTKVVVANRYWGLIHKNDLRHPLRPGQRVTGYVQRLREDQRLSITLNPPGEQKTAQLGDAIMAQLRASDGFIPLHDKSDPASIHARFRCSKNAYKQAIGKLYKAGDITLHDDGIRLP